MVALCPQTQLIRASELQRHPCAQRQQLPTSYRCAVFLLNSDFSQLKALCTAELCSPVCVCLEATDLQGALLFLLQLFQSLWFSQQGRSWHHPGNLHIISQRKHDSLSIFHLIFGALESVLETNVSLLL